MKSRITCYLDGKEIVGKVHDMPKSELVNELRACLTYGTVCLDLESGGELLMTKERAATVVYVVSAVGQVEAGGDD